MIEIGVYLIRGLMVGIEFPECDEIHEDLKASMVLDLGIIRVMFNLWNSEE